MKSSPALILGLLCVGAFGFVTSAVAAPEPALGKAADNKILAQKLLNAAFAANPDLVGLGLHAIKPGATDLKVVAQTLDIIGRPDTAGDLEVVKTDMVKIYPTALPAAQGPGKRMKVMQALRDRSGRIIGLAVLSFKPGPEMTALAAHERAAQIMRPISDQLPDLPALFTPVESL